MKKINELVKYQLHIYFNGSKYVMPLVATAIFLLVMYSGDARPVGVVTSCVITCNWVFLLMVWVGLSVSSAESPIMEQIIFFNNLRYFKLFDFIMWFFRGRKFIGKFFSFQGNERPKNGNCFNSIICHSNYSKNPYNK